jgi:hypothetical protein
MRPRIITRPKHSFSVRLPHSEIKGTYHERQKPSENAAE